MGESKDIIYEDMKDLRSKSSGEEMVAKFNKELFGGLKKKEVDNYIDSLTKQFNRTDLAYKERIDEFTTFTEMLTKERDDALLQLQKRTLELKEARDEVNALIEERNSIINTKEMENQEENELRESYKAQKEDSIMNLSRENYLLKEELENMKVTRNSFAGENSVLKMQIENAEEKASSFKNINEEVKENLVLLNSSIRQDSMKKSLLLSEYSEKQMYSIERTSNNLSEILASMESMKKEVIGLYEEFKDNKFMDFTPGVIPKSE